jgi:PIN domain nuclease of toxin-antitoxin system
MRNYLVSSRLLLDSQALLFAAAAPEKLTPSTRDLLQSEHTEIYVSVASIWELLIKARKGKLDLGSDPAEELRLYCRTLRVNMLPIMAQHAYLTMALENIHKDPFDHMLVAQAKFENLSLVTADANVRRYGVQVIW